MTLSRTLLILVFAVIAALLLLPIAFNVYLPANSHYSWHLVAITQAKLAMSAGQFPLRTTLPTPHSFAYPLFQFYSPSSYMIAGMMDKWVTFANAFMAYKLTLWLFLMMGAIYLYRLLSRWITSDIVVLLSCIIYLIIPHYFTAASHTGTFNQVLAMGLIPVVLFYTFCLFTEIWQIKNMLIVAFVWYLLATIHFATFIAASLFVIAWMALLTLRNLRQWKKLLGVLVTYGFGVLLASWYVIPLFLYGKYLHAYTIDAAKHIEFIHAVDSLLISSSLPNQSLDLRYLKPLVIQRSLLNSAEEPIIALQGNIPEDRGIGNYQLTVLIDDTVVNTYQLKPGTFHWSIPLKYDRSERKSNTPVAIEFKIEGVNDLRKTPIPIKSIVLDRLLNPDDLIDLKEMQKHCRIKKDNITCTLDVPKSIRLVELPIFYYPHLLEITLNNQIVNYWSIFHRNKLIAGVIPESGSKNEITMRFRGSVSGNQLSFAAWAVWLLCLIYFILRKIFHRPAT